MVGRVYSDSLDIQHIGNACSTSDPHKRPRTPQIVTSGTRPENKQFESRHKLHLKT